VDNLVIELDLAWIVILDCVNEFRVVQEESMGINSYKLCC